MTASRVTWTAIVTAGVLASASPAAAQATCNPCTIGVVLDGPWERNDEVLEIFEREVLELVEGEFVVRFPPDKRFLADWTLAGARRAVETLLADPEVDVLLTSGPVSSTYVGRRDGLSKPAIAPFVLNPEIQGIPVTTAETGERVSGVPNLAYITFPASFADTLDQFREVASFEQMTLLVNEGLSTAVPELLENTRRELRDSGVQLDVVRVADSVEAALEQLPGSTEAVYIVPLMQLPPGDFDRLVQALIDRRLPSFSYWGRSDVERGILASSYLDVDFLRLARRIAVTVRRVLRGEAPATIGVDFRRRRRLTLNMRTARAIGVYPSWRVLTEAEILQDERPDVQRELDLAGVAQMAVAANLDLLATERSVAAGAQAVRVARAPLWPLVGVSAGAVLIDRDRAASSLGSQSQRTYLASASVSQVLYSDAVRAGADVERHRQESRIQQREQIRLEVIASATVAYLDVLRSKAFERIQRENLNVTRSNLELAQTRQRLGVAGASEVIRWETEIAHNRREVIDANARRNIAEIELNRVLNRPLEEPFATREIGVDDPSLKTTASRLDPYVNNPFAFDIFREFMTAEALALAPELAQLDAAILAQQRAVLATRRAFWAPTVSLQGDVTGRTRGEGDSGLDVGLPPGVSLPRPNGFDWTVGLTASLPLFSGGARRGERAGAEERLAELQLERDAVAERVEQRVRTALHAAGASHAGIELAAEAADAARRNLTLVTDAYEQGVLSILDLLDAQNAALVADLLAANAVYDYLVDLMNVQRAIGRFDFFRPATEQQAFLARLAAFFAAAGYQPRPTRNGGP